MEDDMSLTSLLATVSITLVAVGVAKRLAKGARKARRNFQTRATDKGVGKKDKGPVLNFDRDPETGTFRQR